MNDCDRHHNCVRQFCSLRLKSRYAAAAISEICPNLERCNVKNRLQASRALLVFNLSHCVCKLYLKGDSEMWYRIGEQLINTKWKLRAKFNWQYTSMTKGGRLRYHRKRLSGCGLITWRNEINILKSVREVKWNKKKSFFAEWCYAICGIFVKIEK